MIPDTSKICMAFRKLSSEVDALIAGGMVFHILIVDGKKEYLFMPILVVIFLMLLAEEQRVLLVD
jgi:hypothetical protein